MIVCVLCGCSTWDACEDPRMPTGNCAWFVNGLCSACVLGVRAPDPHERLPHHVGVVFE